jgi:hypothetical protein
MSPSTNEIEVLGRFIPSEFTQEVIQAEMRPLLPRCCRCERISVRIPQGIAPHPDNLEWHQDGGGDAGTTKHMVIWASETPTEIRDSAGAVFQSQPFELVWFNNCKAHHRQPAGTNESSRWFAAVRCSGEIF